MIETVVVSAAHLDAAMASSGDLCESCVIAQAFNVIVGFDDRLSGTYVGFTTKSGISPFCETGQKIASLYDSARKDGDKVMIELRSILPTEVTFG